MTATKLQGTSHICIACAGVNPTCCVADPQSVHLSFPLSEKEWERMSQYDDLALLDSPVHAQHKGSLEKGRVLEMNFPEFLDSMLQLFPRKDSIRIKELLPMDGQHHRLSTRKNGSCVFLGPEGCVIPRQARPWYCRLFPMWYHAGELLIFHMPDCLLSRQATSPVHAMNMLGVTRQDCLATYYNLRCDWGLS